MTTNKEKKWDDFTDDVEDTFRVNKDNNKVAEDKPVATRKREEKKDKEAKKAVFIERTKEQKEADTAAKKAEIDAIEQKYKDKENPQLDPKWNGVVCGSCLQTISGTPDLREAEEEVYKEEPVNYVQCSECKSNEKDVRVFVQETETGFIEVPRSSIDPVEEKKQK